jgi:glutathione synthase
MIPRMGVLVDPIGTIKPTKDTTLALLLGAQARGWALEYMELGDIYLRDGVPFGLMRRLTVRDDDSRWHEYQPPRAEPLASLDVILMRKDPPFDLEYVYSTYILEQAERAGVLVVNRPQSLRDANEKMFTAWFPQCCPPTLVSRSASLLREFLAEHGDIIIKPLDGMGGDSIFRVRHGDPNVNVILETMTRRQRRLAMAQRYLPEIANGDKRILVVDGQPVPHCLARIPAPGETRGNLAAGGRGEGRALTDRDRWLVSQVAPVLRERGLLFVGLDVIGDYLTEVNVTSPTCLRELERLYGIDIKGLVIDAIERRLAERPRSAPRRAN